MVATSYDDDRALGKRLFAHGPEALERFIAAYCPEFKVLRFKLWQAGFIARITGRQELTSAYRLIANFDRVGELGDPAEANALLGAPTTILEEWFRSPKESEQGFTH